MPFTIHLETTKARKILEIANEKYVVPDDIDECNDEIAEIWNVISILSYNNYTIFDNGYNKTFRRNGTDT